MIDANERENELLRQAGKSGGQYLEQIDSYDLRHLTQEQWTNFIRTIIGSWAEVKAAEVKAAELVLDDEIPF